ncbi:MAG: hypothetical protein Q4D96_02025 [Propionibacteriaceae bacterium]|nr:hypothetical protein [Propionibacteriaceae bacterium]
MIHWKWKAAFLNWLRGLSRVKRTILLTAVTLAVFATINLAFRVPFEPTRWLFITIITAAFSWWGVEHERKIRQEFIEEGRKHHPQVPAPESDTEPPLGSRTDRPD